MSEIDLTRDQTEASGKPDLTDLGRALTDGTLTSAELTEAALARAEEDDALRSSFISLTPDRGLEEAQASDARRRAGESRGSLDGIPVAWKDLFDVEGTLTTAGSACRGEEQHAAADAPVVAALAEAGMVCIGKTNLSELAFSGLGTNSHFGTPINPHRADRVPGGSSSGAAVAVATGAVTSAIGTDTAGSVRVPAALCGVVGYKTSSSRLPREGVFALAPALDTIGVLATSVAACAMVEAAMRGDAPLVPTADQPEQLRLIVPTGVLIEEIDPDVAETTERALSALTDAGASIERRKVSALEATQALFAKHGPLSVADAGRHHSALLDSPAAELLEPIVRQRLEAGRAVPAEDYEELLSARSGLQDQLRDELAGALLAFPTVSTTAPVLEGLGDPDTFIAENVRVLRAATLGSYLDTPGITLPTGFGDAGLPVGLLLSAAPDEDRRLIAAAQAAETVLSRL